jgi:integrase
MNATINVLCYKSKTLSNGENPLMICVSKNGKRTYKSLGISINPIHWDFDKNKPKRNCPDKEQIERLIIEKLKVFNETILDLNATQREYTSDSLINRVEKPFKLKTVKDIFHEQIEFLETSKRKRYAESCKTVYNSLTEFNTHLNIYFSDIDTIWLKKYEAWLRNKNLAENTIGIRFRTLRVMYNVAIEEKCVNPQLYPFRSYKVSKLHKETAKRALTKSDIKRIINYEASNEREQLSLDIFIFSYLMGGINFVDIASLTKDNIINNQLVYTRKKTNKLIKLPIHPTVYEFFEKYHNPENPYLFPILFAYHKTEQQKANRIHKIIGKTNKDLKEIGESLKLPIMLTTYVARHSFATVLKRSGVKTSVISESLGHSSEKVTQYYLDSFENDKLRETINYLL